MSARLEMVGLEQIISQHLPWLDTVAARMERAFDPFLGQEAPRGPRELLYGTWFEFPVHAAVVRSSRSGSRQRPTVRTGNRCRGSTIDLV
jgi:hypothetical protein